MKKLKEKYRKKKTELEQLKKENQPSLGLTEQVYSGKISKRIDIAFFYGSGKSVRRSLTTSYLTQSLASLEFCGFFLPTLLLKFWD